MERRMYFLTPGMVDLARREFAGLNEADNDAANHFFETFGRGNTRDRIDRPAERFNDYELLLDLLNRENRHKYDRIHKGTPFYFLAWTAFDVGNYEKALFYLDAAISEDSRAEIGKWVEKPAGGLMVLDAGDHVAQRIRDRIRTALVNELAAFRERTGERALTVDNVVSGFCRPALMHKALRTSVSALYTFILEFKERHKELRLRSTVGGSMQLLLAHLFKGGLCLETLLKYHYPRRSNDSPNKTLRNILEDPAFRDEFCRIDQSTSAFTLGEIFNSVRDNTQNTAFLTSSRLRNASGHSLVWDDIFDDPEVYARLYHQEMNAIMFVISTKWINKAR